MPRRQKGKTDGFVFRYSCEPVNVVEKVKKKKIIFLQIIFEVFFK